MASVFRRWFWEHSEIRSDAVTPPPEGEEVENENNVSLQNTAIAMNNLPSYWALTKDRPAVKHVVVHLNNAHTTFRMVGHRYTVIQNLDEFVELQALNVMEQQMCQIVATDEIPAEMHLLCMGENQNLW
eukprot:scaffold2059_cov33-Attheya_sp.AAC.4